VKLRVPGEDDFAGAGLGNDFSRRFPSHSVNKKIQFVPDVSQSDNYLGSPDLPSSFFSSSNKGDATPF